MRPNKNKSSIFTIPWQLRAGSRLARLAKGVAIRHSSWPRARSRGGRRLPSSEHGHWRTPGSFGPNVRDGRNYTRLRPGWTLQFTTAAKNASDRKDRGNGAHWDTVTMNGGHAIAFRFRYQTDEEARNSVPYRQSAMATVPKCAHRNALGMKTCG